MLNTSTRKVINVDKANLIPIYTFKQEDDGLLLLDLYKGSVALDITGQTVSLGVKRADGTLVNLESNIGDNPFVINKEKLDVKLKNSIFSTPGVCECDLQLVDGAGKMTTASFYINVSAKVINDSSVKATNDISIIELVKKEELKRKDDEADRKIEETKREKAEDLRKENALKANKDEFIRKENETIRIINEDLRKQGYSTMDSRIDNLVLGQGSQTEVIDAHLDGVSNVKYPTLKSRLDAASKQLFDSSLSTLTTSDSITTLENAVDGLTQIDSIKGKTLQNIIENSDFGKGTANWVGDSGTLSVNGNIGIVTGNGSNKYMAIMQLLNPSFFMTGHKIYSKMSTSITDVGTDVKPTISMQIRDASIQTIDKIDGASQKTWYTLSGISTLVGYTNPYIRAIVDYETANVQKGRGLQIQNVIMIDLTQMFGTGNEPTKEWCDSNLSHFDGIKSTGEEFSDVNLFDKSKVTLDAVIMSNGNISSSSGAMGWYATDFISVKEGMEIKFNKVTTTTSGGLGFYNSNTFVSWISNTTLNAQGLKIRIPVGVTHIRASNHTSQVPVGNFIINQEEYKIEVLSIGKNLFNKNNIVDKKTLEASTGKISDHPFGCVSDYINVNQNSDYTIAKGMGSGTYGHCFYNSDKVFISGILASAGQNTPQKITTPTNTSYIRLCGITSLIDLQQFEKGTISTQYEPYKQDKNEILLKEPHKGLPNGVVDEIVGEKVYNRIEKEILNANGDWVEYTANISPTILRVFSKYTFPCKMNSTLICSNFAEIKSVWNLDTEGITTHPSLPNIYINILKSKLATPDVAGLKKWLSENPTEVYYELAEPIVSSINPSSLKSFKDGSVILNNVITPIIDLKYPTSIGGRLGSVESTLDNTVDRVRKLEEALFVVTAELLEARKKMVYIGYATLDYFNGTSGKTKVYKNMQVINVQLEINFQEEPSQNRLHYATVQEGFRPISNIMNEITDATGSIVGILEVETDGKFYIRKKGSLSSKFFRGNITYMTAE